MRRFSIGVLLIIASFILSIYTYPLIGVKKAESIVSNLKTGQKVKVLARVSEVETRNIPVIDDILADRLNMKILLLEESKNVVILAKDVRIKNNPRVLVKGYVLRIPFTDVNLITGSRIDNIAKVIFQRKKLEFKPARVRRVPGIEFYISVMIGLIGIFLIVTASSGNREPGTDNPPPAW